MPNWCSNSATLTHSNPAMLERLANANKDALFADFVPVPQELLVGANLVDDAELSPEIRAIYEQNLVKHNAKHWYDWCMAHWGTKWDASDCSIERHNDEVSLAFDTAWGPPSAWYQHMVDLGYEVKAYYVEPNMTFCGRFINGSDEYYEYDTIEDIPADILAEYPWLNELYED
jgi:hypothetical protein